MVWLAVPLLFALQYDPAIEGQKALDEQRYAEAVEHFKAAIQKSPDDYAAHFNLGLAYGMLGKDQEAIASYEKTLDLKPGLYEAELNLGMLLARLDPQRALAHLAAARQKKPDNLNAALYHGDALFRLGKLAEAETAYNEAVKIDAKSAQALVALGRTQVQLGKLKEAEVSLTEAADLDPQFRPALLELAGAYAGKNQFSEAISLYQRFPEDTKARDHLGELLLKADRPAEAIPHLEQAARSAPTTPHLVALAAAYVKNKQEDKALPILEQAVLREPENFELRMVYGRTLRDSKNFTGAMREFTMAARYRSDSQEAWSELAGTQFLLEIYEQSLASLDRVKALGPEKPGHIYLRAIILDRLKQYPPAMETYQQFLLAAQGKHPDEEFKARQRVRVIKKILSKR